MKRTRQFNEEEAKLKYVVPLLNRLGFKTVTDLHFEYALRARGRRHPKFADIIVKRGDQPILLIETKASRVNVRAAAGVRQAIDYARTFSAVIPYAIISNGRDAALVDVLSGVLVDDGDTTHTSLSVDFITTVQALLRREALQALGALDMATIRRVASAQCSAAISLISGSVQSRGRIIDRKYIPGLYVARGQLDRAFDSFLSGSDPVFAIFGDAGMGKTNSLCHLAERLAQTAPVFFYHAAAISTGLRDAIRNDFSSVLGDRTFQDVIRTVAAAGVRESAPIFVVIDALNEFAGDRRSMRSELNELVRSVYGSPMRLIVSCRTLDENFWTRNDNQMLSDFGRSIYHPTAVGAAATTRVTLGALDSDEFSDAWNRYRKAFTLSGNMSVRMQGLCKEPFMLRLVAELYRNERPLPDFVEPLTLFRNYFDEKFPFTAARMSVRRFLYWMARRILESGEPRVRLEDISPSDTTYYEKLLDENVILWRNESHLYFNFELFLEFVVAQVILDDLGDKTADAQLAHIKNLTQQRLVNMPGIVENLLLSWQADPVLLKRGLQELLALDDRWKAIACSTIRKLEHPPVALWTILDELARDDNPFIRLFAAQAADTYVAQNGWENVFRLAEQGSSWEARETAANIAARAASGDPAILDMLWHLADDYHWRVRRAAGYAMQRLWMGMTAASARRRAILEALPSASWRQRYTLSIALVGTNLDGRAITSKTVFALARDPNPQVRWGVANYLPRYKGARVHELVALLKRDGDPWVRARVVDSLVRMAPTEWRRVCRPLEELAADAAPMVRVRVARELSHISDRLWAQQQLKPYLADAADVRFAALYTLESIRDGDEPGRLGNVDAESRLRILRERVARRDIDVASARFAPVREYISRRTELAAVDDAYMSVIDTMCSLISSTSDSMRGARAAKSSFIALLSRDLDEAVRWALVLFVVRFGTEYLSGSARLATLRRLARDSHWWVRREVAIALSSYGRTPKGRKDARHLLNMLKRGETAWRDACRDEVLHFIRLGLVSTSTASKNPARVRGRSTS